MKRNFYNILLAVTFLFLASCEKNNELVTQQNNTTPINQVQPSSALAGRTNPDDGCPETTIQLTAGQFYNAGSVVVSNDADFIYVTYTTANGYLLTQTHLFAGNCNAVPVNNQGNPAPGQFPHKTIHNNLTSYTYQIPVSLIPAGGCGCIAAHAVVVKLNELGEVIEEETAWGNGVQINPTGNWGMKFDYCSCIL
ncbi:MAG: hypothetical protein KA319_09980 [Ferruginibacter sp.]|nr:hypothetical protein [Ferruginibacter sp.]